MPSRKEFAFPKGNTSSLNKARAFWLLSWTLKKWKVKNVRKQGSLGDLRCGGAWKQFVFLTRITGESDGPLESDGGNSCYERETLSPPSRACGEGGSV